MNYVELQKKYEIFQGTNENSFKNNFKRNQEKFFNNYGLHLMKKGRGKDIIYYIEEEEYFYTNKAFINDFDGEECRSLITTDLILTNEELYCLLVVLFAPMGVFRGTYDAFMTYAELDNNKLDIVKQAIAALINKGYMEMNLDTSTTEGYFTLISKRYIERDCLSVPLNEIRKIIAIAKYNHKRSWVPVFKMWAAISALDGQVSTAKQLARLTGMSINQIYKYGKLLKDSNVMFSRKVFVNAGDNDLICIGSEKSIVADWGWLEENK